MRVRLRDPGLLTAAGALVFWGLSAFDFWAVMSGWAPYADAYGHSLLAWLQGLPLLRKFMWGASVAFGLAGAGAMLWRKPVAGDFMLGAVGLIVGALAYDLVFANGLSHYGGDRLFASGVVIIIASALAWAAYRRGAVGGVR